MSACDERAATLTEVFPCLFLSCKANARVQLADMAWPSLPKLVIFYCYLCLVLYIVIYVPFSVYVYCLCIKVCCTAATGCQPNCD
jgi:hypothetical protein